MHVCTCVCVRFLCVHINVMYVCVRAHDSIAGHCARFCWHFGGAYQKESGTWVRRLKLFSRVEAFRWEAARVFAFSAWISVLLCFPSVFIYIYIFEGLLSVCRNVWRCVCWVLDVFSLSTDVHLTAQSHIAVRQLLLNPWEIRVKNRKWLPLPRSPCQHV